MNAIITIFLPQFITAIYHNNEHNFLKFTVITKTVAPFSFKMTENERCLQCLFSFRLKLQSFGDKLKQIYISN